MPFFCMELPEYVNTISRTVARQIVRDIASIVGINEDERIYLASELESIPRSGKLTEFGANGGTGVVIELKEDDWEYNEIVINVFKSENPPFFLDEELDISATPIYARTETEINFSATFASKSKALKWRDAIRHKVGAGQRELLHEVNYSYIIPKEVLTVIKHCYNKRENQLGYGDTWKEYCGKHFLRRLMAYKNVKGEMPSINETQVQVQGWWDFEATVEIDEQSNAGDPYEIAFTYNYQYDRPTAVSISYPFMIHNQLLDLKFIPLEPIRVSEKETKGYMSTTRFNLDGFVKTIPPKDKISGFRIPEWDTWLPRFVPNHDLSIFNIMLQLDIDNPTNLCNLLELGDYQFTPSMIKYISANHKNLHAKNNTVIHVQLYKDDVPLGDQSIRVNQDMSVEAIVELDLRCNYHLRIALLTELRLLTPLGRSTLLRDKEVVDEILLTLDPKLADKGLLPMDLGGKVSDRHFNQAVNEITTVLNNGPKGIEPLVYRINFIETVV